MSHIKGAGLQKMRSQNRKNIIAFIMSVVALSFLFSSFVEGAGKKTQKLQAYRGAPPTIPHDIKELGRKRCLDCHFQGLDLGLKGGEAYKTPHPERANCLQCHLPQKDVDLFKDNSFVPLAPKEKSPLESNKTEPGR